MMDIKVTAPMKQHQPSRPQSHTTIRGSVEQQLPQKQLPQPPQPLLQCSSSSPSRPRVASASSLIAERPEEAAKPRTRTVTILAFDNSVIN